MNKLFRTLHWNGLPDDEEDAWATLRLFTRHDDNVEEAIRYVRVLEAVLSGDAYETSVRQQQYMGNHYYFDPRLREAHITKELWRAMRLASCGETPACSTTRASRHHRLRRRRQARRSRSRRRGMRTRLDLAAARACTETCSGRQRRCSSGAEALPRHHGANGHQDE